MDATNGRELRERLRMSGSAGNASVLPMLVVLAALTAAVLVLAMVAAGVVQTGGGATPAWSGDQGPPGAASFAPEQTPLRADRGGN
jgi:hypothetical protein